MRCAVRLWLAIGCVFVASVAARGADLHRSLIEVNLGNGWVEGIPLSWSDSQINLLSRDGRWLAFQPNEAKEFRKAGGTFQSYTAGEMRNRLAKELPPSFEISTTRHFVVAYPKSSKDTWAQRLEDLYGSFAHYFSVRGFSLTEPEFPLIAIVWPNKAAFHAAARGDGVTIRDNVLGYYSQKSNRVMLYEISGQNAKANWRETADTIIHEATHQTAFNVGIHSRYALAPQWVVEGLATMFEAPGVYDSRTFGNRTERINRGRQMEFKEFQANRRKPDSLSELISRDNRFREDPSAAYAEGWALTFFLVETMPREYHAYLKKTAAHPLFRTVSDQERLADFMSVFGDNFKMLDARFLRFMNELK